MPLVNGFNIVKLTYRLPPPLPVFPVYRPSLSSSSSSTVFVYRPRLPTSSSVFVYHPHLPSLLPSSSTVLVYRPIYRPRLPSSSTCPHPPVLIHLSSSTCPHLPSRLPRCAFHCSVPLLTSRQGVRRGPALLLTTPNGSPPSHLPPSHPPSQVTDAPRADTSAGSRPTIRPYDSVLLGLLSVYMLPLLIT